MKGIDPKAREIAKDLARRSGMTLGEWLNQVILEDEAPLEPPPRYPTFGRQAAPAPRTYDTYSRPVEDAFRLNDALDRLSARIEAAEHRAAGAIGGIEQAVSEVMARLGDDERRHGAAAARMDGVMDALQAEQARIAERLGKIEQDAGSGPGEVLKAVEAALAKVAGQVMDGQARTGESFDGLRQELDGVYERLDGAFTEDAAREMVETVIARLSSRLEQAERRTTESLQKLESAFGALDARLKTAETRLDDRSQEQRLDALAEDLGAQIAAVRADMADAIQASANDGRFERMDQALQALDDHVRAAEQRSAGAIEKMGQEVLRMADTMARNVQEGEARAAAALDAASERLGGEIASVSARMGGEIADVSNRLGGEIAQANERFARGLAESERKSALAIDQVSEQLSSEMARATERFTRGLEAAEQRSAEAIERIGGEVSRAAGAMEQRLAQADTAGAQALERLSGEIARITERLTERIANAERRSAQAIDDVGEQVSRVSERIQERQERASTELSDRIRASEERTAKLLDEARERIDQRLGEAQRKLAETAAPPPEPHGFDAYADPAVAPFGTDGFAAEEADATTVGRALPHGFADDSFVEPTLAVPTGVEDHDEDDHTHSLAEAAAPAARAFADDDFVQDVDFEPFAFEPPAAHAAEPEAHDHDDDPFAIAAEAEAHDPFTDDAELIEPAHVEEPAADFGSGLFAAPSEPDELDADEDWLTPLTDPTEDETAAHQALASDPFLGDAPHVEAGPSSYSLSALASHVEDPGDHADPETHTGFEAADEFVPAEPARPRTTRELVEQARAAARSAAVGQDGKGKAKKAGSLFGGLGKKRSSGDTMRTALLVSGGTAALGVALAGYVLLASKPGGPLPDRVARSLGAGGPAHPVTGEVSNHPLAAVALSPKPIASPAPLAAPATGAGGAELYNAAVQKIGAGDKAGVAALQKAANLGYAPAQFYLAKLYEDGQAGLSKDMVEARRWTERAAEGGDRKAMHNLALYFFEGAGGPKNLSSAADWFHRAADQGLVDSQYNLARLYEEGLGVPQNPAEAYKWYLIAARSGDGDSRLSALRIKSQLSPEAQSAAARAAEGFQVQTAQAAALAPASGGGSDVATAQRALSRLGFYQGPADGASSPALKLAIAAYQRGQGLPATGQLDPALSQRLAAVAQQ